MLVFVQVRENCKTGDYLFMGDDSGMRYVRPFKATDPWKSICGVAAKDLSAKGPFIIYDTSGANTEYILLKAALRGL